MNKKILIPVIAIIVLFFLVGTLGYVASKKLNSKPATGLIPNSEIDISNWKTYKNDKYGFEIKYPPTWRYSEDHVSDNVIKDFNFYKASKTLFAREAGAEAMVTVYPKQIKMQICGNAKPETQFLYPMNATYKFYIDYYLDDSTNYYTIAEPESQPLSWSNGLIEAWLKVEDKIEATEQTGPDVTDVCKGIIGGKINMEDRLIQEKIISTFRFVK